MIILLLILLSISLYGLKYASFHSDYMSWYSTNAIKGIFAVIILCSHMRQYLVLSDTFTDYSYILVLNYIGQMMVTMYLFYSGFGLMESLQKKPNYKNTFLKKRVLKILVHFDVAVLIYIIMQLALGNHYTLRVYLGSMIGWDSVGNSNWFIFVILALYLFFYFSLCLVDRIQGDNKKQMGRMKIILFFVLLLSILLWAFLWYSKGKSWWVDNIFAFSLGLLYSMYKSRIDKWITKGMNYYFAFIPLTFVLVVWHQFKGVDRLGVCTCLFALWIVFLSMKVKFDNQVLQWLGTQAFAIYILQRLPMIAFSTMRMNQRVLLFVILVVLSTLIIACVYTKTLKVIDKSIFI